MHTLNSERPELTQEDYFIARDNFFVASLAVADHGSVFRTECAVASDPFHLLSKSESAAPGLRFHHEQGWMIQHRQGCFGGVAFAVVPFLNPRSPAMNVSSMCGISVAASTASP